MKKTYKKIKTLVGLFGLMAFGAGAQISGTVTIDALSGPSATNFQSFTALATALNGPGVNGPLTVNVVANSGPYNEQPQFSSIPGSSSANRVTINGNGNILTFNGTVSQPWTLGLNGTDNMTVNNLNMIGTNSTYAMVVKLANGADNNRFNNCTMTCPQNGTSSSQTPFSLSSSMTSAATTGVNSGNFNSINSCTLSNGYYGVVMLGLTGAPYQTNNSITNSIITDFYYYGVFNYYSKDMVFNNNVVERPTRTSTAAVYCIYGYYSQGFMCDGNKFHKLVESNLGVSAGLYGIYNYGHPISGTNRNTYRNNIFTGFKNNSTIYALYVPYASADCYNNTIDMDYAGATTANTIYGIYGYGNPGFENTFINNIITMRRGGSGNSRYPMYFALTGNITVDKNDIHTVNGSGTNYIGYYNGAHATMAAWQSSGMDANGFNVDPMYVSATDLHPTNPVINNMATPLGIFFDQEKAIRNQQTPDIGALEFLTPMCSGTPGANSVAVPNYVVCPGEDVPLSLSSVNASLGYTYQWQSSTVSNVGPFTNVTGANSPFFTAPNVTANTFFNVVLTCTVPGGGSANYVGQVVVAGPTSSTVPYYEGFETIGLPNRLPNCSWSASSLGNMNLTSTNAGSGNRVPRTGNGFASFNAASPGTSYYYTNPIQMNAGITYSAALWYATEYMGYNNWTNLSIMVGPNQNPTGMVTVASVGPAISGPHKLLNNIFTVPSSGQYYVAIKATSSSGSAMYLSWDDLSITIPCEPGSPNSPTVSMSASTNTICAGQSVNLTANGADDYSWSSGATGSSINESPLVTTNFIVYGTNTLTGCVSTQVQQVVVNPAPPIFVVANNPIVCAGQQVILSAFGATSFNWSNGGTGNNIVVNPTVTTVYSVVGLNSFGCSATYPMQITVNPNPNLTAQSSHPVDACKDDVVNLSVSGATTYQWMSSTSPNVYQGNSINLSSSAPTTFTVYGTNAAGCVGKTTIFQNVVECTGLSNLTAGSNVISIYPNPTSGEFTIELNNNTDKNVEVVDMTGRVILSSTTTESTLNVNINELSNGIYFVKIRTENSVEVLKVVKQ